MGYTLDSTKWPAAPLPEDFKELLESLFLALDDSSESGGSRLADEVFTQAGEFVGHHTAKGSEEIRQARKSAWSVITKRRHELLKVYAADSAGTDLMVLGKVTAGLKNGQSLTSDFAARVTVEHSTKSRPRVRYYQPIVDTAPIHQALKQD